MEYANRKDPIETICRNISSFLHMNASMIEANNSLPVLLSSTVLSAMISSVVCQDLNKSKIPRNDKKFS